MAIKYVSEFDSPEDPGGLIREVLDMGADFLGPAEDILLTWTLRLDPALDPAIAARRLLESYEVEKRDLADTEAGRLITLLRQAANSQLSSLQPQGRRRRKNMPRRSST